MSYIYNSSIVLSINIKCNKQLTFVFTNNMCFILSYNFFIIQSFNRRYILHFSYNRIASFSKVSINSHICFFILHDNFMIFRNNLEIMLNLNPFILYHLFRHCWFQLIKQKLEITLCFLRIYNMILCIIRINNSQTQSIRIIIFSLIISHIRQTLYADLLNSVLIIHINNK